MSEEQPSNGDPRSGGGRQGDRRRKDRRRTDRRAPPPPWRRPAALVAYGVLGTLALVVLVSTLGRGGTAAEDDSPERIVNGAEARQLPPPSPAAGPAEPAFTSGDYERLIVEGDDARGRLIQVELFCGSVQSVSTRSVDEPDPLIRALEDADGRVSGAECRWGPRGEDRREDFFLLLGGEHAETFASAPMVEDGFVRRRHLVAEVEWIGRSDQLSLRTAGVLRGLARR